MNLAASCSLFLLLALPVAAQHAAVPASITEKIEWTWADRPDSPDPKLPNVLLLGDSITRAYYPATVKALQGVANVYLFATSACSADPRFNEQLKDYFAMAAVPFRVVHFNNGMHGWKYTDEAYAQSLPGTVQALEHLQPGARLIWANTTPVRKDSEGATNARIDRRNAAAASVMQRFHIPTDDQHAEMANHTGLHTDDVHWNDQGSALQSEQVAAIIRQQLAK